MTLSTEELRRQVLEERVRQARALAEAALVKTEPSTIGKSSDVRARILRDSANTPVPVLRLAPVVVEASATPPSLSAPPVQPTTSPFAPPPPQVPAPASLPAGSSTPISVPTFVRFFKLCVAATIVLAGTYFGVKSAYPFLQELATPGSVNVADSKDVPASVKILQQTRAVVAKNNANVDHLHAIIEEPLAGTLREPLAAAGPNALVLPSLPPQPALPPPKPKPQIRLERLTGLIIDELHISGVIGGKKPRIMVDGVMVGIGGVVDAKRRLRFVSIDESRRVIVFGNGQETIEKSY